MRWLRGRPAIDKELADEHSASHSLSMLFSINSVFVEIFGSVGYL
jgi:hypothetical protein